MTDKSVLCVDLGTASLKWARFAVDDTNSPVLTDYGISPVHDSGTADVDLGSLATEPLRRLLADDCPGASHCCLCASASHLFTRFLRFPAMDQTRLRQVLEFELKEHFPVPLDALTWDHQVLEPQGTSQVDTLLTAVKSATAERWLKAAESAGRRVDVLDAGPAALANAFLYNYGELPGCSLLLDIGSRTSTVYLFEDGKCFFRTVNLGGNAITLEFSKEAGLPPEEAEQRKIREAMVDLSGGCEAPGSGHEPMLARITRQFMTRLSAQVLQTVHFYRGQKGGSPPSRLYLAGGGSMLPFTARFFEEKLEIPAESFNPFRRIRTDPAIDRTGLAGMASALGCAVGVALRAPMRCPIEMNLTPASVFRRRQLRRSGVYIAAAAAAGIAAFCTVGLFYEQLAAEQRQTRDAVSR
ncbi:MAG TPA: pilus assembly protein PilM, partial [Candidatus Paceibacterota bacterium]|nr:pilus assembly protein PilM [Candidatus Paceibacterota bacterium]